MFTVGGYDIDKFAPNQTVTWNYVTDTTYWTVKLSTVQIGDTMIPLSTPNAIIDTGTSYLAMPDTEFESMLVYWSDQGMHCSYDRYVELYQCICTFD